MQDKALVTGLDVSNKNLETLDLSEYVNLEELNCSFNRLKKLDLSRCVNLNILYCNNNQLTELDLSKCSTKLFYLNCNDNQLTNLDLRKCNFLRWVCCSGNQLKELDVTMCASMWFIYCSRNSIKKMDVRGLQHLQVVCVNECPQLEELLMEEDNISVAIYMQETSMLCEEVIVEVTRYEWAKNIVQARKILCERKAALVSESNKSDI